MWVTKSPSEEMIGWISKFSSQSSLLQLSRRGREDLRRLAILAHAKSGAQQRLQNVFSPNCFCECGRCSLCLARRSPSVTNPYFCKLMKTNVKAEEEETEDCEMSQLMDDFFNDLDEVINKKRSRNPDDSKGGPPLKKTRFGGA